MEQKSTQNAVNTDFLSNRGIVQRFLNDRRGYFFSIRQIAESLEQAGARMDRKTIRAAIREISALNIGLEKMTRPTGRRKIPINFYSIQ